MPGCAGSMMQQLPLAPTLAHILQEQGPSVVYTDVLQLVQQLRFVQLPFLLPAAVLHADKEDASKKRDGSLH